MLSRSFFEANTLKLTTLPAKPVVLILGFLFLEYKTIDIFPEKYYYTDTIIKQMLNYLIQAFIVHTINMEKNNKFIVCNAGKEIYHEENV